MVEPEEEEDDDDDDVEPDEGEVDLHFPRLIAREEIDEDIETEYGSDAIAMAASEEEDEESGGSRGEETVPKKTEKSQSATELVLPVPPISPFYETDASSIEKVSPENDAAEEVRPRPQLPEPPETVAEVAVATVIATPKGRSRETRSSNV